MFKSILKLLTKYKKLLILDICISILYALVYLIVPIITRQITGEIIPSNDKDALITVSIILIISVILYAVLKFFLVWVGHVFGSKLENEIRVTAYEKLQLLSFDYFDKNKVGQILSKVTTDANYISEMLHHLMEDVIIFIVVVFIGLFFMFQINVILTVTFLVLVFIQLLVAYKTSFKMSDAFVKLREKNGELTSNAESGVASIRLTRAYTNEKYENKKFTKTASWYFKAQVVAYKILGIVQSINNLFIDVQTVAFIIVGGFLVINGNLTYGDWIAFYIFYGVIINPIKTIFNLYESFMQGISTYRRYQEVMSEEITIKDKKGAISFNKDTEGDIRFNQISFSYADKTEVFKDLSIDFKKQKVTAIVGESGIGKSTLIHLIPRFYNLDKGTITIDGVDICDFSLKELRDNIGFVEQNVTIFNATLRENILYGKLDASDEEVQAAVEDAALTDLVASLEDGLETMVGEKGSFLSGGQKQRVSLARIFLKNPPIVILDEATSALDTITEKFIQKKIEELSQERTVLIVAHRLSTIQNADEIIVLGDNKILQRGSHNMLIKEEGHYKKLYDANKEGMIL